MSRLAASGRSPEENLAGVAHLTDGRGPGAPRSSSPSTHAAHRSGTFACESAGRRRSPTHQGASGTLGKAAPAAAKRPARDAEAPGGLEWSGASGGPEGTERDCASHAMGVPVPRSGKPFFYRTGHEESRSRPAEASLGGWCPQTVRHGIFKPLASFQCARGPRQSRRERRPTSPLRSAVARYRSRRPYRSRWLEHRRLGRACVRHRLRACCKGLIRMTSFSKTRSFTRLPTVLDTLWSYSSKTCPGNCIA